MKSLLTVLCVSAILATTGCRGYRSTVSVSLDSPILPEVTGGQRTSLKVSYTMEAPDRSPSPHGER